MTTQTEKKVREVVLERPAAARVFERFGIDYCCGGNISLAEACRAANLSVDEVIAALERPELVPTERDWKNAPLAELAQYIVDKHHAFTREEIKRLNPLISKVVSVHGTNHPELLVVQSLFGELSQEMTAHMMKEEQILFPFITEMEAAVNSKRPVPPAMFGTIQNPVAMMMREHESSGRALQRVREVTREYAPPADACVSYRTLYQALTAFEADLHQHIHLENNILFPRAMKLESGSL